MVCDANPITEGHILIIPKDHLSCIGEYSEKTYKEFINLYDRLSNFLIKTYGSVSSFEHGNFGQTVFHSHVHLLPFKERPTDIVTEGEKNLFKIYNLSELKNIYKKDGGYLFFSIGDQLWIVNKALAIPRFFRDRFAKVLGRFDRGNWKEIRGNKKLMEESKIMNEETQKKWKLFVTRNTT